MTLKIFLMIGTMCLSFASFAESSIETYFNTIKSDPKKLTRFLWDMPKGGDLHIHLSGATYAEKILHYAKNDSFCIDRKTYVAFNDPSCKKDNLLNNAIKNNDFYEHLIDAWSMRNFHNNSESGHDHFFQTFDKFSLIVKKHRPEILAELTEHAGEQNESYLEIMYTPDNNASGLLGKQLGWNNNFSTMRDNLLAAHFDTIINTISSTIDQDEKQAKLILNCDTNHPQRGCLVKRRYLYQVLREQPPEMVFAQLLAGFEAAVKDKRLVGLNMVQPEDGLISMRDYNLQMQMVGFLHERYPNVPVSLHAGELSASIVPSEGLKSHIFDAVTIAKANRIGHGVDIAEEDHAEQLLKEMSDHAIMVEINLSSNFSILNIKKTHHPLPLYLQYNVPITLSTDDEGISRTSLTNEYELAVKTFNLTYDTLKRFARNSLTYSFLPGSSLWTDRNYQSIVPACNNDPLGSNKLSSRCQIFLNESEKAMMQWDLENRFTHFEL